MLFKDIIGHHQIKQRLIQTAKDGRISHAQLFLGSQGSGNLALALAYAQFLSCESKQEEDSCGVCSSCKKYQKLVHPDLHFIYPVATTKEITKHPLSHKFLPLWRKAFHDNPYLNLQDWLKYLDIENKQASINTEECNEIVKALSLKSFESEFKVMVIWYPEKLHHAAAPKLLKILEEPPQKTLFLLVAENHEALLATILSRLQLVKVGRIDDESLKQVLVMEYNLSDDELIQVVKRSEGSYLMAKHIIDQDTNTDENQAQFLQWMRWCFTITKNDNMAKIVEWVERISKIGRENQKSFIDHCLYIFRESLMLNYGHDSLIHLGTKDRVAIEKFAPFVNGANCQLLIEEFNKAHNEISRNANPKILFLDLSLKTMKWIRVKQEV